MRDDRSPAWWPTRILLAVGVAAVGLIGLFLWSFSGWSYSADDGTYGSWSPSPELIVPFAIAIVGLAWMIRIVRGPRDQPPPWRYRDR